MSDQAVPTEKKPRTQYANKSLSELTVLLQAGHRPAIVIAANVADKASVKSGNKANFNRMKHALLQFELAAVAVEAEKYAALYAADHAAAEAAEIQAAGASLAAAKAAAEAAIAHVAELEAKLAPAEVVEAAASPY